MFAIVCNFYKPILDSGPSCDMLNLADVANSGGIAF